MSLTEKLLFLAVGMLIIIFVSASYLNKKDALQMAKEKYDAALQGNDRADAIAAGRAYYRALRGGDLTIEDERAILLEVAHFPEVNEEEGN